MLRCMLRNVDLPGFFFFYKLCFTTDFLKIYKVHAKWSGTAMKWMRLNAWIALQKRGSPHLINFIWNHVMLMKSYAFDPPTPSFNFSPQKGSFTPVHKSSINWSLDSPAKHFKTKRAHIYTALFPSLFLLKFQSDFAVIDRNCTS